MISVAFLYVFISFFCLTAGFFFYHLTDRYTQFNRKPFLFYLITGLISITAIAQIVVLFHPINTSTQAFFLTGWLALVVVQRKSLFDFLKEKHLQLLKQPIAPIIVFCSIFFLLIYLTSGPSLMDDTESYHIQMVKWIKEYGTTPGLANLHERYGFNSSWFSSIAIFDFANFNSLNYYTVLNGVVSCWLGLLLCKGISSNLKNKESLILLACLILFLASWPILRGNASTANYDSITALLLFTLFIDHKKNFVSIDIIKLEWVLWSAYLFTVRITNAPILLLSLFVIIFLLQKKKLQPAVSYTLLIILLLLPFIIRNIILSGYPFFPSLSFDWFTVDWKANRERTEQLLHFIKYYNRVSTGILPLSETVSFGNWGWIPHWFKHLFSYDKLLLIPGMIGFLLYTFIRKKAFSSLTHILFIAFLLQTILWFFVAPDPRFLYGPILCGVYLFFYFLFSYKKIENTHIGLLCMIIAIGIISFTTKKIMHDTNRSLLLPAKLPVPEVRTVKINDQNFYLPHKVLKNWNPRCFDSALPCLYEIYPGLTLRGKELKEGFKIVP